MATKKRAKKSPPEKPQSEMTDAEKVQAWRRKRAQQGALTKPGKKKDSK